MVRPSTADGEPIRTDNDFSDPAVIQGLLSSIQLPSFRDYFGEGYSDNLPYLMSHGLNDVYR